MGIIVVDATVLIAAFLKNGHTREALLDSRGNDFVAPMQVAEEMAAILPNLVRRSGLDTDTAKALLGELIAKVSIPAAATYHTFRPAAIEACKRAEAWNDDEYVALALSLDAAIWTYDKDFRRIKGITTVTTGELLDSV